MKQKLKAMLGDDRGVSPVIGVILMVAITVILAAVIGTFVLGLGDSLEQAPQSTLNADSENSGEVSISHDGGDALPGDDTAINVEGNSVDMSELESEDFGDEFSVGDSVDVDNDTFSDADEDPMTGEVQVQVIHKPSESVVMDQTIEVQSD